MKRRRASCQQKKNTKEYSGISIFNGRTSFVYIVTGHRKGGEIVGLCSNLITVKTNAHHRQIV